MFGGINPKQVQGMMKKMGIAQVDIDAKRVIIECEDKDIIIENPSVAKITMQGQENFQVTGEVREQNKESFDDSDVKMVMEKTGKSKEEITKFLKDNDGDIALAIIQLKK